MKLKAYEEDPRVTAYVFGELGADETESFEQEMRQDPELQQLVDEFRAGVRILEEVVSDETASDLSLDPERRNLLDEAIRAEQRRDSKARWWKNPWRLTSLSFAAACILVAAGFFHFGSVVILEDSIPAANIKSGSSGELLAATELVETELLDETDYVELRREKAGSGRELITHNESLKPGSLITSPLMEPRITSMPAKPAEPASQSVPLDRDKQVQAFTGGLGESSEASGIVSLTESQAHYKTRSSGSKRSLGLESSKRWSTDTASDRYEVPAKPDAEGYAKIIEKGFTRIADAETATSTFSADVDTASYANVRRYLNSGQLPPVDAVRIEEMINYFSYDYAEPEGKQTFTADVIVAGCPWQPQHRLARIGIKAASMDAEERKPMNLVFLIDVSGSMSSQNKLPLLKRAMELMVHNLNEEDRVAIVTYAGSSGLVLDSTPVSDRHKILSALDRLKSDGSTAGAAGIEIAYRVARANLIDEGQNRVILCTDGDFNVGVTDHDDLTELIRRGGKDRVFLNIFGFGMGNIKDDRLEQLSNDGNGTYGYIDSFQEAQKVFGEQLQGTLATVAKDVKFQLEFNPFQVAAYRLIGYENRMLAREDFNDDTKDAGEVGAGHTVTALYEIVPAGVEGTIPGVDEHRYLKNPKHEIQNSKSESDELFFLKIRYKDPDASKSQLMTFPIEDNDRSYTKAGYDFQFAAAVAQAGQLLRGSKYAGKADWETVLRMARAGRGEDPHGYRAEFIRLSEVARELQEN